MKIEKNQYRSWKFFLKADVICYVEKPTLYTSRLLKQDSTLRRPFTTTAYPELQLQQAASDVAPGESKEAANIIKL